MMNSKQWKYLEQRPNSWRKQLYIKGKKLLASDVWTDTIVNQMTPEEVAYSKDLPIEVVTEAIEYCQANQKLIEAEAIAERSHIEKKGYALEPKTTRR